MEQNRARQLSAKATSCRLRITAAFVIGVMSFSLLLAAERCTVTALSPRISRAGSKSLLSTRQYASHFLSRSEHLAFGLKRQRHYYSQLWASATDEDEVEGYAKTAESEWNVPGLKKEVQRSVLRCHKKIGKASQRLSKAQVRVEELTTNPARVEADLLDCPDLDTLEYELTELQGRLRKLNALEKGLHGIKSNKKAVPLPPDMASLAVDLGVDDQPNVPPARGATKPKGPRVSEPMRKPYRRYFSFGNVEIRVGKQAEDNDELTTSPKHRDGADWWMHAAGCPGSHVVIRSHAEQLEEEVVQDAAALAARQSKCNTAVIKVSLTRCRDITKPPGAKAGLVMLTGKVRSVIVNMKEAEKRLERLDGTVLVN